MKSSFLRCCLFPVALLVLGSSALRAQDKTYGFAREVAYTQTSSAAPAVRLAYFAIATIEGVPGSFRTPAGVTSTIQGTFDERTFATVAQMNAAFPDGSYTITIGSVANIPISVQSSLAPGQAAQVTNGTWNQSRLVIDPTRDVTLQFNPYLNWAPAGGQSADLFEVNADNGATNVIEFSRISNAASGPNTPLESVVIPAGKLVAGRTYKGYFARYNSSFKNLTAVANAAQARSRAA